MSDLQLNNLIKTLEQIIANNLHYGSAQQIVAAATDHLHKLWTRSMKHIVISYTNETPDTLSTQAQMTVAQLKAGMEK